jgi:REP element-mobilizing transposase RayT
MSKSQQIGVNITSFSFPSVVGRFCCASRERSRSIWPVSTAKRKRNFTSQYFWARGYFVSTVGRYEAVIRECIRKPEQEDVRLDQLNRWR